MNEEWISHTILANPKNKAAELIAAQHKQEVADLVAQVAVMGEILTQFVIHHEARSAGTSIGEGVWKSLTRRAKHALAGAPRVLWAGTVHRFPHGGWQGDEGFLRTLYDPAHGDMWVIVLPSGEQPEESEHRSRHPEQSQESEQGYKLARGVLPWDESDERPEDVIAASRGRPRDSEEDDPALAEALGAPADWE